MGWWSNIFKFIPGIVIMVAIAIFARGFSIGLVSNFRKLREEGMGKLALVYLVCLFGFIIWIGLFISWIFFHGITPPVAS